jgi:GT2 family glycosyltransferase
VDVSADNRPEERESSSLADVEVVLVSYRSKEHVETLLSTWPASLRVVVVDNSHDVDGLSELVQRHPNVRYVDGGGQGFGRAANRGAFSSHQAIVLFVNPDSRPTAADLAALADGVRGDDSALAHAATTVGHDGEVEIGVGGWEPSPLRCLVHALGLHKRWPRAGMFAQPQLGQHEQVDWVSGACMAVTSARFRRVGGFDEAFFVYAEDMALGRRARKHGWRSVLREDVVVSHNAGSSGAPSGEMLRLRGASFAHYVLRYHALPTAEVMRVVFALGCLLRALKSRLGQDRSEARLYLKFAVGVLTRRAFVNHTEVAGARFREVMEQECAHAETHPHR